LTELILLRQPLRKHGWRFFVVGFSVLQFVSWTVFHEATAEPTN
jgi:hypothetical protein